MSGRSFVRAALAALCLPLGLASCASRAGLPSGPFFGGTPVPHLDHVIVVMMENKSYDQARTPPYTASLIARGSSFSQCYAVTHPSQPNYLALWSGSTLGVTNDVCPAPGAPFSAENLGHACEAAGLSWRAYSEDLPSAAATVCTANAGSYTRTHAPWVNFTNLNHQNERPYADLAADIAAGTLPNLAIVVPNGCHNTHSCPIGDGDAWLAANLPSMLGAVGPTGMVVLMWDEDDQSAANHVLAVFMGEPVKSGYVSNARVTQYGMLRTICEALQLPPFGAARYEAAVSDVWK